jgi:hypothetical protein
LADNVTIPATGAGTATPVVATDDVVGVHYQRVKLVDGTLDSTAAIAGDAVNGLDVDVTRLPALVAGTANIGDVDVLTVPAPLNTSGGGLEATALRITVASDSTGVLSVDDNAGSLTVDGTITANQGTANATPWNENVAQIAGAAAVTAGVAGLLATGGNVAHDGVDAGNPLLNGARAIAHGTNPTAVAAADRTVLFANRAGVPFFIGGHPNVITRRDTFATAQTDVALVTVAAGTKIVVTRVLVTASNANAVNPSVIIGFGATNTPTAAGVVAAHDGIPPGGGLNTGDGSGILGVGADGEDLRITSTTTGTISVVISYYTIES